MGIVNDIFERDGFMENVMEYAAPVLSAEQGGESSGTHQAVSADGMGNSDGERLGGGA